MENKIKELIARTNELQLIIYAGKHALDIQKVLWLNADKINKTGKGKRFLSHCQTAYQDILVLSICKIFDKQQNYELSSLPHILDFIKNNNLNPLQTNPINDFTSKYNSKIKDKLLNINTIKNIYDYFCNKHKKPLKKYKDMRDKVVAHPEFTKNLSLNPYEKFKLPSPKITKEIIVFSYDCLNLICSIFSNKFPHYILEDKAISSSLITILEELGIKDIKTDFTK
jgi:hypothetical protein